MPTTVKMYITNSKLKKINKAKPKNLIKIVDFQSCTHFLIDIIPRCTAENDIKSTIYDFFGVSTPTILISTQKYTHVYADINQHVRIGRAGPLAFYSFVASHTTNFYYNTPNSLDNIVLTAVTTRVDNNIIPRTPNWSELTLSQLPIEKISGHHHIHFTAKEVWSTMSDERRTWALANLNIHDGMSTTAVGGMLLWINEADPPSLKIIERTQLFKAASYHDYTKIAKNISTIAKSLQNLQEHDLRQIFELETLVNRITGSVDWKAEMENRTSPNVTSHNYEYVFSAAHRLFSLRSAEAVKPANLKWGDFWANRWQWTASGSFHSQYTEDLKYQQKEQVLRNKFISAIAMPDYKFDHFHDRTPQLVAWSSSKYEWGKMRAIYGTDFTSYVLSHFAFYNCEDTLGSHFPVGVKARPSYVSARVDALLTAGQHYCLDFEDFNSQHSFSSMKAVLFAWLTVNRQQLSEEQYQAGIWTIQSLEANLVHDNIGLHTSYQSQGTLMSGWRLTTFVNSVLNYIYTQSLISDTDDCCYSLHNGDDVIMSLSNLQTVQQIQHNARRYNVRLSTTKCHFAAIAEFLRVDHFRGEHGQYLSRNIATLMHGRIESKKAVGATDAIEALENRLSEFIMRGGSHITAASLRKIYYARIGDIYKTDPKTLYIAKSAHAVCGGLSTRPDACLEYLIEKTVSEGEVELPHPLPGVHSYAKKIQETLEITDIPIERIVNRIYTATLGAVKLVRSRITATPNESISQYTVYRGIYKAYAYLNRNASLGKALMTGFVVEVVGKRGELSSLASALASSKDKMLYLDLVL